MAKAIGKYGAYAAVLASPTGLFEIMPVQLSDPQADEIMVEIEACGICHTDSVCKHMVPVPSVLGHEGVGRVKKTGKAVRDLKVGDRVILCYPFCGVCHHCVGGAPFNCVHNAELSFSGKRLDGRSPVLLNGQEISGAFFQQSSFSTLAVVPARAAVRVETNIPIEILAALPCGVSTGAGAMLYSLAARPGSKVLVFGAGAVGLSAAIAARICGAMKVVVVDRLQHRVSLAAELGATHTLVADHDNLERELRHIEPAGFDIVLDTSSAASAWRAAFAALASGGRFGFVSVPQPFDEYTVKPIELMFKGASMHAVVQGGAVSRALIPLLIEYWRQGRLPLERLVRGYSFSAINQAFLDASAGDAIKPVLNMKSFRESN